MKRATFTFTFTFTYTDAKGKISERKALVVSMPSNKMCALDVADISLEEAKNFSAQYEQALYEFNEKINALKQEFDLKHSFRQFIYENMEDIDIQHIQLVTE